MQINSLLQHGNYLVHISNVILVAAFAVRDMLWLRILAIIAAITIIPFYFMQAAPLWSAVAWTAIFLVIHVVNLWILILERQPVKLTREEEQLYTMTFGSLDRRSFLKVLHVGEWKNLSKGEKVATKGVPITDIIVLLSGKVSNYSDGHFIVDVGPGSMIGTMSIFAGNPPKVDALVSEPVRCMSWRLSEINAFAERHPKIRLALKTAVSGDLAKKLQNLALNKQ